MITKKQHTRNDVGYEIIESSDPVECALTVGEDKYVLNGKPAIETMSNSYKYGDQVQLTVFNKIGSTVKKGRVAYATKYDRMEIFFDRKQFIELVSEFLFK